MNISRNFHPHLSLQSRKSPQTRQEIFEQTRL